MGGDRAESRLGIECAAERQEDRVDIAKCPAVGWDAGDERGTRSGHSPG